MADFYGDMAKMAGELLSPTSQGGLGQGQITLIKSTVTQPSNPWEQPTTSSVSEVLKAAARGVDKELVGVEVGGIVIAATDIQIVAAVPFNMYEAGDSLAIDGNPVQIISYTKIPAAGTTSAIKFIVRA